MVMWKEYFGAFVDGARTRVLGEEPRFTQHAPGCRMDFLTMSSYSKRRSSLGWKEKEYSVHREVIGLSTRTVFKS